jgi:hypothetical protein
VFQSAAPVAADMSYVSVRIGPVMSANPALASSRVNSDLVDLVQAIRPCDDQERDHLATTLAWIGSGANLYRIRKPDVPATHLVSYFLVHDPTTGRLLLVDHRNAGLWLPPGVH